MANEVVAHLNSGTLVKGTSFDVDPARPVFHVKVPNHDVATVKLADLKALYFVKSLDGNKDSKENQAVDPNDSRARGAFPLDLEFKDGEKARVLINRYPPKGDFFFVVPADPKSNNIRILVNRAAVASLKEAEKPA